MSIKELYTLVRKKIWLYKKFSFWSCTLVSCHLPIQEIILVLKFQYLVRRIKKNGNAPKQKNIKNCKDHNGNAPKQSDN